MGNWCEMSRRQDKVARDRLSSAINKHRTLLCRHKRY